VNRGTNSYVAQFQSIMLKSVKRPDKGKNEELLVTEHKYAFVFYTSLPICGTTFPVMVMRYVWKRERLGACRQRLTGLRPRGFNYSGISPIGIDPRGIDS